MSNDIIDGTGQGYRLKVDKNNRGFSKAFGVTAEESAAINGDVFNTSTDVITLTTAGESAVYYIKNTNGDDFLILEQFLLLGESTGGSGTSVIKYFTNPTGGDISTSGTPITVQNRKLGDSKTLTADVYKGAEGLTVSGGVQSDFVTAGFNNTSTFIIPQDTTLAISITPPAGNTSMDVTFGINLIANASEYAGL